MGKISSTVLIVSGALVLLVLVVAARFYSAGQSLTNEHSLQDRQGKSVGVTTMNNEASGGLNATKQESEFEKVDVSLETQKQTVTVGETVIVSLVSNNDFKDIVAAQFSLVYDASLFSFVSADRGDLFSSARELGPNEETNRINYGLILFPGDDPVQGSGEIARFTFTAVKSGTVDFLLAEESLLSAVGASAQNVLGTTTGVSITVN